MIVFKRVKPDWTSGHGASYRPGTEVSCDDWDPTAECGGGLHFAPNPYSTLGYAKGPIVACEVGPEAIEITPTKIKAKSCRVLCEIPIPSRANLRGNKSATVSITQRENAERRLEANEQKLEERRDRLRNSTMYQREREGSIRFYEKAIASDEETMSRWVEQQTDQYKQQRRWEEGYYTKG